MTVVYDKDGRLELRTFSTTECGDTITAYVPGAIAGNYHFTSAIAVQLLKANPRDRQHDRRAVVRIAPKPRRPTVGRLRASTSAVVRQEWADLRTA